tara:strand:- start:1246 stop:1371 length:126 start_codon:yes stop_codon:yes gene_type:complete
MNVILLKYVHTSGAAADSTMNLMIDMKKSTREVIFSVQYDE